MDSPPLIGEDTGETPVAELGDAQQHAELATAAQQERLARFADLTEQADASPTTDSIPMTAARTIEGSRR
jgi:hypothetical protein